MQKFRREGEKKKKQCQGLKSQKQQERTCYSVSRMRRSALWELLDLDLLCFYLNRRSGFPGGLAVKNLSDNTGDARDTGSMPGSGRSLEKETATHSSILAWEMPWTEEPGGLQSMGSQRVGHNSAHMHTLQN